MERQKEFDPTITDGETADTTTTTTSEDRPSRRSRLRDADEETTKNDVPSLETNSWTEKVEEKKEAETVPVKEEPVPEPVLKVAKETQEDSVEKKEEEEEAERPRRSYLGEQVASLKFKYFESIFPIVLDIHEVGLKN